jgi:NADH:ubiquinone oxidoreductase subunit 3 (subunit A)
VGIPLDGQGATFDASDLLVLDSLPRKVRAARAKERRARFILGLYVFVAGLLTLGLFSFHLRRSEKTLSRELFEAGVTSRAKESSRLPLLFAIVSLFFAFSLAVLWIVAR